MTDICNCQRDQWNSWTKKSKHVPFKAPAKGYGDGEHKLAAEYNIQQNGQNVSYDLTMPFGEHWECKKIDSDGSFRLGVEITPLYAPIIANLLSIFHKIKYIDNILLDDLETQTFIKNIVNDIYINLHGRSETPIFNGFIKNEA